MPNPTTIAERARDEAHDSPPTDGAGVAIAALADVPPATARRWLALADLLRDFHAQAVAVWQGIAEIDQASEAIDHTGLDIDASNQVSETWAQATARYALDDIVLDVARAFDKGLGELRHDFLTSIELEERLARLTASPLAVIAETADPVAFVPDPEVARLAERIARLEAERDSALDALDRVAVVLRNCDARRSAR